MLRFLPRIVLVPWFLLAMLPAGCGSGGSNTAGGNNSTPSAPDFSISFSASAVTLQPGSSIDLQFTVLWLKSVNAPLTVTITGLPQGVTASPSASISLPSGSSSGVLGLTASSAAALGKATLMVTASDQGSASFQHQYTVDLTVAAPPQPAPTPGRTSYILTGAWPESIVYDRAHKVLYASMPSLNQVLVIDPATHQTLKVLPVPAAGQSDLSPDGSQIVVGSDTLPQLTFISAASQGITRVVPFTVAESNPANSQLPNLSGTILTPVFLAGGDVLFLTGQINLDPSDQGPIYRYSASTGAITKSNAQPSLLGAVPKSLSRTPDGTKVLVITTQNEMDIYDAATDSITASNSAFASFAGADPANPRFAAFDSNGFEILDTSLHQLASFPFSTTAASSPYGVKFSLDGTRLFVAQSGMFGGLFSFRTVDTMHNLMGSQAPLMSFFGDDEVSNDVTSEYPLAIDETNLIYGAGNRGIAIDDPLNYYSTGTPANGFGFEGFRPDDGPVGFPTQTHPHDSYPANTGVYFFGANGPAVPSGTVGTSNGLSLITTPPINTPGPASVEMVEPDNSFSFYPAAFTYGVQTTGIAPSAGPASGGITATVTAYGIGGGASTVTVMVGGVAAKVTAVQRVGGLLPNPLPYYAVSFVVPPGAAGSKADVTVTASGYSSTLSQAFTYEQQISNFAYPGGIVPSNLVYDPHRRRVYLLTSSQVDVFSLASNSFLDPIVPPTLNGKLELSGLDISVDGSTLAIANLSDQSVALVNPDNPSSAPRLVALAGPTWVAATSKGTFLVLAGSTYELNPSTGSIVRAFFGVTRLSRSADGSKVFGLGSLALWDAATSSISSVSTPGFIDDGAISADGTTISCFNDVPGGGAYQFILDANHDLLNSVTQPEGLELSLVYGQFLNASGALFYLPGISGISIYDVHRGTRLRSIGVVEPANPSVNRAATIDDTGTKLFLLTEAGLDVIQDAPPLSVRSASPLPNTVPVGSVITLRGAGFVPGATVTIGGHTVAAIVIDPQTLNFSLPAAVSDLSLAVSNPDGATYTY